MQRKNVRGKHIGVYIGHSHLVDTNVILRSELQQSFRKESLTHSGIASPTERADTYARCKKSQNLRPDWTVKLTPTRKKTSQEAGFFDICDVSNEQNLVV